METYKFPFPTESTPLLALSSHGAKTREFSQTKEQTTAIVSSGTFFPYTTKDKHRAKTRGTHALCTCGSHEPHPSRTPPLPLLPCSTLPKRNKSLRVTPMPWRANHGRPYNIIRHTPKPQSVDGARQRHCAPCSGARRRRRSSRSNGRCAGAARRWWRPRHRWWPSRRGRLPPLLSVP